MEKVPNLNGVWEFKGYEPAGCGGEIKECHINRSYFKYIPHNFSTDHDLYRMAVSVSQKCENRDATESWVYLSPNRFVPLIKEKEPGFMQYSLGGYKYGMEDEGRVFRLNLHNNFIHGECWERYEL